MRPLGYLNKYVLQWFFIRLARYKRNIDDVWGWKIIGFVKPMSGWNGSDFIWLGRFEIVLKVSSRTLNKF